MIDNHHIAVYEIIYEANQSSSLGQPFIEFDCTDVQRHKYREIFHFHKFVKNQLWKHANLSGLFSPKFSLKTGIASTDLVDFVRNNPGYDVYLFHPYPLEISIQNDFLELAELEHPGIRSVLNYVWEKLFNEQLPTICLPDYKHICCHCNFFIASEFFWSQYSKFISDFVNLLESNSAVQLHNPTYYTLDMENNLRLPMAVFVFERALSHFIMRFIDLTRVINYPYANTEWRPKPLFKDEEILIGNLIKACGCFSDLNHEGASLAKNFATKFYYFFRKSGVEYE